MLAIGPARLDLERAGSAEISTICLNDVYAT